jgi:nucleolar complex protein 3
VDDLPSVESSDEDEASLSSNLETSSYSESDDAATISSSNYHDSRRISNDLNSDTEMPYEALPRRRRLSWDHDQNHRIPHLPIKLPNGLVQKVDNGASAMSSQTGDDLSDRDEKERLDFSGPQESTVVEDISTGTRFGRPPVIDIIGKTSRTARIREAREEIAFICQKIVAEPESSVSAFVDWTFFVRPLQQRMSTARSLATSAYLLLAKDFDAFPPRSSCE